jgi:acyl-[acyl-carrier-protein] desaturase
MPVLKKWRIFERDDFTGQAARERDDLAVLIKELEVACDKFELSKQRQLEREARRGDLRLTARQLHKTEGKLSLSRR